MDFLKRLLFKKKCQSFKGGVNFCPINASKKQRDAFCRMDTIKSSDKNECSLAESVKGKARYRF